MRDVVPIRFPVSLSGLPSDSFVELNGLILVLKNSRGEHWDSGWEPRGASYFSDDKTAAIDFYVKKPVFEKFKSDPVSARLLLAFTLFHDQNQKPMVVPNGEFTLPNVGLCSTALIPSSPLACRVPVRGPKFLLFTSRVSSNTCPLRKGESRPEPDRMAHGSLRGSGLPAEPGISPIHDQSVYLRSDLPDSVGICPGTPLILSNPEQVGRARVELQLDHLSLPDYQQQTTTPQED